MNIPKTIIFIGPQGSGKGTQAKILVKKIGAEYIETGAMLRAITKLDTDFGKHVRDLIDKGNMVTDEDIEMILRHRLKAIHKNTPIVFDGVPRRIGQAKFLLDALVEVGRTETTTLYFDLSHEQSIDRLSKRRHCTVCGRSAIANGNAEQKCEKCGGELVIRKDDAPEFIKLRLQTYDRETLPVVDYLKTLGHFYRIDAGQDIAHVAAEIEKILGIEGHNLAQ